MLSLVKVPSKLLRKPSLPVVFPIPYDQRILLESLLPLCSKYRGVGLAAPQVGISLQAFAIKAWGTPDKSKNDGVVLVNPTIIDPSNDTQLVEEGCLSIPKSVFTVKRPASLTLIAFTLDGDRVMERLSGLVAQCVSHEVDHLRGRLVCDLLKQGVLDG